MERHSSHGRWHLSPRVVDLPQIQSDEALRRAVHEVREKAEREEEEFKLQVHCLSIPPDLIWRSILILALLLKLEIFTLSKNRPCRTVGKKAKAREGQSLLPGSFAIFWEFSPSMD